MPESAFSDGDFGVAFNLLVSDAVENRAANDRDAMSHAARAKKFFFIDAVPPLGSEQRHGSISGEFPANQPKRPITRRRTRLGFRVRLRIDLLLDRGDELRPCHALIGWSK